jgi:pSer/pThr/pTyr-binding forkhead associated (FHA) protein
MRPAIVLMGLPAPTRLVRVVPDNGAVVVGRSSHCDLIVDHPSVSRRHARVTRTGDSGVRVVDLGSRNGTFVDGVRVGEAVVPNGRHVRFGGVTMLVCEQGAALRDDESGLETDSKPCGECRQAAGAPTSDLTGAQREVFDLLVRGLAEKAIAKRLGVSVHTAHNHVCAIYRALHVHSRAELMAHVLREEKARGGRAALSANLGQRTGERPRGSRGARLKLYYQSADDREAYVRLLDGHGIAYSDAGGFVRIDAPVTLEVMRALSAAVFN